MPGAWLPTSGVHAPVRRRKLAQDLMQTSGVLPVEAGHGGSVGTAYQPALELTPGFQQEEKVGQQKKLASQRGVAWRFLTSQQDSCGVFTDVERSPLQVGVLLQLIGSVIAQIKGVRVTYFNAGS